MLWDACQDLSGAAASPVNNDNKTPISCTYQLLEFSTIFAFNRLK